MRERSGAGSRSGSGTDAADQQLTFGKDDGEKRPPSGLPTARDGSAVETCPECETDVPSDGTYVFCPLCGHEL